MVCYVLSVDEYLQIHIMKYQSTFISTIRQPDKSDILGLLDPKDESTMIL